MKKILIVEDEKPLRQLLVKKLEKLGYECVEAADGEEALEKTRTEKPDLMLLDIIMPKKNGIDVLEEVRIKNHNDIPIIILSNLNQEDDMQMAKSLNINGYIIKSDVSLQELSIKIHEALQ